MNCDALARWYRWLEYAGFGRALERRREEFLPDLRGARRALVLGDGDGRFLAALLRVNPAVCVDYVDNSLRMLELARGRTEAADARERVRFHHADAREWPLLAEARYDLITTHFFLDCFTDAQLPALVEKVSAAADTRACWVVSEFRQPARGAAAWRARAWIAGLYAFFRLATGLRVRGLPAYGPVLRQHGFRCERAVVASAGMLISERWQRS